MFCAAVAHTWSTHRRVNIIGFRARSDDEYSSSTPVLVATTVTTTTATATATATATTAVCVVTCVNSVNKGKKTRYQLF